MSVAILGGGAFGTALAIALAGSGPVTLWARDAEACRQMAQTRRAPRLPDIPLPDVITVEPDLARAAAQDTLLLAVPMQALSGLLAALPETRGKALVACCKGLDLASLTGPSKVIATRCPEAVPAVLTGPSFAADIARGLPTALTLACADAARGEALQHALSTQSLRLYRSTDSTGAELGGALKNVIAIACGAAIGAGLGDSARAAVMTRGFAEMTRLAAELGGRPETLAGLSGLGDLALTCGSELSRNYRYGLALGRGESFDPAVTVEGAATARAVAQLAERRDLPMPVCAAVARVTMGELTVPQALESLLARPLRQEDPL
ncbi:NAD(P)H-dependent glycerol-3-phosphate dehydrogenase [Pseudoponticoccus marisrubri]|uniref:Glycerol-3-phosphate dehydrogenase [NAD(P)+] n=1 Tax=Pseudoponticoccus marisrubri TaxID=1685382 RepID=A0A0W7WHV2_9RHOB|nr:NAD(P)H-dependent glycerol-3-phosphate dehydrogenase [Pseudoponticoccus marisrubri]KUF10192.1 glycerol-3-phosphate dehydrogenase [Pseudoponticoccus marisrubri]